MATHLPTLYKPNAGQHGTVEAHFARPNAHWQTSKDEGAEALLIYSGGKAIFTLAGIQRKPNMAKSYRRGTTQRCAFTVSAEL